MSLLQRNTIASAIFAVLAMPAMAQNAQEGTASAAPSTTASAPMHRNPASEQERQARMEQHWQRMKSALKITGSQEAAWTAYVSAMKPQARMSPPMDRKAFTSMTTPQRIDAMQAMRSKHQAEAERRDQAMKTFYAALAPEQQKTFDTQTLKMFGQHHGGPRRPHGAPPSAS